MNQYLVLDQPVEHHLEVKKSQFITYLKRCDGEEAFKAFLTELKAKYPDARHYCYAHKLGSPWDSQTLGFSDDGEPKGTAGKPMLNVLMGREELGEIAAVVVRYFGGTKLGTGGLVRAYTDAVNQALSHAAFKVKELVGSIYISADFNEESSLRHLCSQQNWRIENIEYRSSGIIAHLCVPLSTSRQDLNEILNSSTNGRATVLEDNAF